VLVTLFTYGQSFINLPHLLQAADIEVDLVAPEGNSLLKSRGVSHAFASGASQEAFVKTIEERLATGEYDLLVSGDEDALIALYRHGIAPELQHYLPYAADSSLARAVGRKDLFQDWCSSNSIPTPITRIVHSWAEFNEAAAETGWPCFLKRSSGSGGRAVFLLENAAEAEAFRPELENRQPWLVQELVRGKSGCVLFFADRGEVRAWFALDFVRCLNDDKGPMVISDFIVTPALAAACQQVAASSGITGLTGFDFIETAAGEIRVIDSHLGRTTAANHFGQACGVHFGEAMSRWMNGETDFTMEPQPSTVRVVKFPEIIDLVFQKGFSAFSGGALNAKAVKVAWGSRNDRLAMARMAWGTLVGNLIVALGRCRQSLLGQR
jgi:hypothetical protein